MRFIANRPIRLLDEERSIELWITKELQHYGSLFHPEPVAERAKAYMLTFAFFRLRKNIYRVNKTACR